MVLVPEGMRVPTPWDRRPSSLAKECVQVGASGALEEMPILLDLASDWIDDCVGLVSVGE